VAPERGFGQGFDRLRRAHLRRRRARAFIADWGHRRSKDVPFFLYLHSLAASKPPTAQEGPALAADELTDVTEKAGPLAGDARVQEAADGAAGWFLEQSLLGGKSMQAWSAGSPPRPSAGLVELCVEWLETPPDDPDFAVVRRRFAPRTGGASKAPTRSSRSASGALDALRMPEGTDRHDRRDHGEMLGEHGSL